MAVGTRGFSTTVQYNLAENGANGIYKTPMPASGCPASWTLLTTPNNGWPAGTGSGVPYPSRRRPAGPHRPRHRAQQPESTSTPRSRPFRAAAAIRPAASWASGAPPTAARPGTSSPVQRAGSAAAAPATTPRTGTTRAVAVDPNNPDTVFMDTYDIWKSTDGGATFLDVTCGYSGGTTQSTSTSTRSPSCPARRACCWPAATAAPTSHSTPT